MDYTSWRKTLTPEQVEALLQHDFAIIRPFLDSLTLRIPENDKLTIQIAAVRNDIAQINEQLKSLKNQQTPIVDPNLLSIMETLRVLGIEIGQLKQNDPDLLKIMNKLEHLVVNGDETKSVTSLQNLSNLIKINNSSSETANSDMKRDILSLHKSIIDVRETILQCDSGKKVAEVLTNVIQSQKNSEITEIRTILENANKREKNAYAKGIQGENFVYDVLLSAKYDVEDVRKKGKSGDYVIKLPAKDKIAKQILVECKNYTTIVPQKEVDKFYADIKGNDSHAGIFISLGSKITGIKHNMHFVRMTLADKEYPVLFIANCNNELLPNIVEHMIIAGVDMISAFLKQCDVVNSRSIHKEEYQIDEINNHIQDLYSLLKSVDHMRNDLEQHKTDSDRFTNKMHKDLLSMEMKMADKLEKIKRSMMIVEHEVYTIDTESPEAIANLVKTKYEIPLINAVQEIIFAIHAKLNKKIDWTFGKLEMSCPELSIKMQKGSITVIFHMDMKNEKWRDIIWQHRGKFIIDTEDFLVRVDKKNKDNHIVFNIIETIL